MYDDYFIKALRMLLEDPERPIYSIARAFGYASHSSFSSCFRNSAGCSPSQYRRENGVDRISRAKRLLVAHPDWPMSKIAWESSYLNVSTLKTSFFRQTGMTPARYRAQQTGTAVADRISRARHLLDHTDKPLDEIAAEVGYKSAGSLRICFIRATGMSPKQYRQRPKDAENQAPAVPQAAQPENIAA